MSGKTWATSTGDAAYVSRLYGSHFISYHYSLCTCQCVATGLQKDPSGGGDYYVADVQARYKVKCNSIYNMHDADVGRRCLAHFRKGD